MNIKKIVKIISIAIMFFTAQVFATPIGINVFVSDLEPKVGQEVTVTLKTNADQANPIYTLSSKVSYDTERLTFKSAQILEEGTLPLTEVPYNVTDTAEGVIVRTFGFPRGYAKSSNFIRYTFSAKKGGQAYIYFLGGQALDSENNDLGVEKKEILLNIGGVIENAVKSGGVAVVENKIDTSVKKKSLAFSISGDTAVCRERDYDFSLNFKENIDTSLQGKYLVSLYNQEGLELMNKKVESEIDGNSIKLRLPANTLPNGNLLLRVSNINVKQVSDKELGVIGCDDENILQQVVTDSTDSVHPSYIYALFIAMLGVLVGFIAWDREHYKHTLRRR